MDWEGSHHDSEGGQRPVALSAGEVSSDSISLCCGVPYRGAHLAEVLLSPKEAKATPLLPTEPGWLTKRDAYFVVLGFFFFRLIGYLAEGAALALT